MDYLLTGSNILEKVALVVGLVPTAALDSFLPLLKAHAIITATRLGVFDALREGPLTAAEIASRCGAPETGMHYLLRAAAWAGYLRFGNQRYRLTSTARSGLLRGARGTQQGFVEWMGYAGGLLLQLEERVRAGSGVDLHGKLTDPALWSLYQRAMLEGARFASKTLAARVPVKPGALRLLDIAGSHGLLGAAICRAHPPMRSTVLDLEPAIEHARALAREEKIDDIVEHRAGNLLHDGFGEANDVVLLSNILHNLETGRIPEVLARVVASATRNATVAIWDIEIPKADSKPAHGDAFAMFCWLISTSGCFTGQQYANWLQDAGLERIRIDRPASNPGHVLVTGRRDRI